MDLKDIRTQINSLDTRIIKLLTDRLELALMVKRLKAVVEDPEREKEVLARLGRYATQLIGSEFITSIYEEIIKESKRVQFQDFKLIGFQGDHGAYSEIASRTWQPDLIPIPCRTFSDVFERTASGLLDFGIVPVENTLGGVLYEVNERLINTQLNVVGAVELPIHHCLLAVPDTNHREIRSVYSHFQALAQCRNFLRRNSLDPVQYYDTAGAAKMLAEQRPRGAAAIASELCSQIYGLEIIKENIEDLDRNMTRFLILSKESCDEEGDKCSIFFSTAHKAGTLFQVLEIFAQRHINLTRIESIPFEPGNYVFFLDFVGSRHEEKVMEALAEVEQNTTQFKLMGCYNERKMG